MAAAKEERPRARLVDLMQTVHLPYPATAAEEGGVAGAEEAAGQRQRRLRIQFQRSPTSFIGDAEGRLSGNA